MENYEVSGQQKKYFKKMLDHISSYENKNISFSTLVNELQGEFEAAEISDAKIIKDWYGYWTPLEIYNASINENVKEVKVDWNRINTCIEKIVYFLNGINN